MSAAALCALLVPASCSSNGGTPGDDSGDAGSSAGDGAATGDGPGVSSDAHGGPGHDGSGGSSDGGAGGPDGTSGSDAHAEGGGTLGDGALPAAWLYTQGGHVYVTGGGVWVGRGVNVDDIFLCGYDNSLWMTSPDQTLQTILSGLVSAWKPSFVRISLGMASYPTTVSWLSNPSQYKTPMTNVVDSLTKAGVYVLVTLRSDASMIGQDQTDGDPEATGVPSDSTTTPDKTKYPTGTDATYVALVDSFAQSPYVLFGLTNEPGGNKRTNAELAAAMGHAVGTIRAEEDKLGVPHHIVSVQGNGWTSDISFYATTPLAYDNVVYEVHGYPPATGSYTYANIPVIIGEYGSLTNSDAFYADLEAKQIPNLAWDFEPYSNCSPDLLNVTTDATKLTPSAWGQTVQKYLLSH